MSASNPSPGDMLRAPLTPVNRLVAPSAVWAAVASASLVGIVALAVLIKRTAAGEPLFAPQLAGWTAGWAAVIFLVLFGFRLFFTSRLLADKAFTVIGIGATFFGLAMLAVFFAQLAAEARVWFTLTPQLAAENNKFLEDRVAETEASLKKIVADLNREMKREMSRAANDEEKKEIQETFEKEIIPERITELEKTAREYRVARDVGVREDLSPFGLIRTFVSNGPSNVAQDAGIFPALVGSLILSIITIAFAVPIGVGAAIYLEEYRSNNWLGKLIQININNLAGVPSVIYGILGDLLIVGMFLQFLDNREGVSARNTFGGGITLALLTLPVVIVSAQEAIRAVPNSIRQGAYALGATRWQTIWRQVLPLAWPGILTGTILALSRAIGEAAPLVLFGANLFVDQTPTLFSRFTALPLQIFGWADRPPEIFQGQPVEIWRANAAMGCIVLLMTLLSLNAIAIVMRNRAQRRMKW